MNNLFNGDYFDETIVRNNETYAISGSIPFLFALIVLSSVYFFSLSYVFINNLFIPFTDETGEFLDW